MRIKTSGVMRRIDGWREKVSRQIIVLRAVASSVRYSAKSQLFIKRAVIVSIASAFVLLASVSVAVSFLVLSFLIFQFRLYRFTNRAMARLMR
ncbi:MAG: hypothetical protein QXQ39_08010 [Conexivisphaerales archaeon]